MWVLSGPTDIRLDHVVTLAKGIQKIVPYAICELNDVRVCMVPLVCSFSLLCGQQDLMGAASSTGIPDEHNRWCQSHQS